MNGTSVGEQDNIVSDEIIDNKETKSTKISSKIVLENVFKLLGRPQNLSCTSNSLTRATQVQSNAFRVLIYCADQKYSYRLTDTFWVNVDNDGNILKSNPEIKKKYDSL